LRNNLIVAHGGAMFLSAFGAVFRVILFLGMPGMGIAQAVQPIAGYNYGAGNLKRVRRSVWIAIGVCTLFMTGGFAVSEIFAASLLRLFSADSSMVAEGVSIMRISAFLFIVFPAYIIAPSFYQALGKPARALILSLLRPVLGAALMIVGVNTLGVMGVVAADPIAVTASAVFAVIYLRTSLRNLSPMERPDAVRR
jgi:Na+-driven multidrug efflux pump